jgi:NAD(P)-dependent dehydrogenase (short-subunit alcohol dehydrogenase family)
MNSEAKKLPAISELIDLSHRRAVVTGGAQGMGLAIAKRLAEAGASIIIADINRAIAAKSLSTLPQARSRSHTAYEVDVRSSTSVAELAKKIIDGYGGADIWINAAGIFPALPFLKMTEQHWDEMLNINLKGTFLCGRTAADLMIKEAKSNGVIINISSTSGHRGRPALAHYVASKHAVEGLTKSMALELGPHGIRVISVAPTLTRTEGLEARRRSAESSEVVALERRVTESIPLGRIAETDDVARVVLFLASDLASFITGSSILVDGGQLAY